MIKQTSLWRESYQASISYTLKYAVKIALILDLKHAQLKTESFLLEQLFFNYSIHQWFHYRTSTVHSF